jgi:hypothetical protein
MKTFQEETGPIKAFAMIALFVGGSMLMGICFDLSELFA